MFLLLNGEQSLSCDHRLGAGESSVRLGVLLVGVAILEGWPSRRRYRTLIERELRASFHWAALQNHLGFICLIN